MPVALTGAVADGDVDFVNKTAHIIGGMPGLPGYSGELIVVDPYAYSRPYGATTYSMGGASSLSINPALTSGPEFLISEMLAVANDPALTPTLVGTEQEPSGPSYHIRVMVTQSALNSQISSTTAVQALGSAKLDLWITQGDYELERLEFATSDSHAGAAAVRLVLSNWNGVAPIKAPPANQFDIPALQSAAY